jgi:acyl-CoA thioester hydrolase
LQDIFVALQQISGFFLISVSDVVFYDWQNDRMSNLHMSRPQPETRAAYRVHRPITTRWMDNDVYGHVNNVTYYSWFDTAVNAYLIQQGALDTKRGEVIGLVVETQCNYFAPLSFPQTVTAGIRVERLGESSVRYEVGIFGEDETTAAKGHFVHVYVDRLSRRPVPNPATLKSVLEKLV